VIFRSRSCFLGLCSVEVSLSVGILLFGVIKLVVRAKYLILGKDLVLRHIDLLEAFAIRLSALSLGDNVSPFLIMAVDEVLDLESNSALESFTLAVRKQFLANIVSIIEVDDLGVLLGELNLLCLSVLDVKLGLLAEIGHELVDHVAHNLNILIIDFLLQIVQTSFDDVTVKLSGNIELGDQVHISIHLIALSLLELVVIEQCHHCLRKLIHLSCA